MFLGHVARVPAVCRDTLARPAYRPQGGTSRRQAKALQRACTVTLFSKTTCGNNSAVECNLAKVEVAGSNPVSRSKGGIAKW